jgi:RNA polymerase-interacting CarD/CdnL/TRCF family regulator
MKDDIIHPFPENDGSTPVLLQGLAFFFSPHHQGANMNFKSGDWVVHCKHGLGQVKAIEERALNGNAAVPYYMVQIADLTIWIPADENISHRLRPPVSASELRKFLSILSTPAERLSSDRRQRNIELLDRIEDGGIESLCKVIRDLAAHRQAKTWNEYDSSLMRRAQKALLGEWCYILSIAPHEAEEELQRLLSIKKS